MTSIDPTAYPRFAKKALSRELATAYTPTEDEVAMLNRRFARSAPHRLAFAALLKGFQRLGYVPALEDVPAYVIVHLRTVLKLRRNTPLPRLTRKTHWTYQKDILKRCQVRVFSRDALHIPARAMEAFAAANDRPADILNRGIEALMHERIACAGHVASAFRGWLIGAMAEKDRVPVMISTGRHDRTSHSPASGHPVAPMCWW